MLLLYAKRLYGVGGDKNMIKIIEKHESDEVVDVSVVYGSMICMRLRARNLWGARFVF